MSKLNCEMVNNRDKMRKYSRRWRRLTERFLMSRISDFVSRVSKSADVVLVVGTSVPCRWHFTVRTRKMYRISNSREYGEKVILVMLDQIKFPQCFIYGTCNQY